MFEYLGSFQCFTLTSNTANEQPLCIHIFVLIHVYLQDKLLKVGLQDQQ